MNNTWNVVENNGTKIIWKDYDEIQSLNEILEIQNITNSQPYLCKKTNSVAFKSKSSDIDVPKNNDYSFLELSSRYIEFNLKLKDAIDSIGTLH